MKHHEIIKEFPRAITYKAPDVPCVFFQPEGCPASIGYNVDVFIKGGENGLYMVDMPVWLRAMPETGENPIFTIEVLYAGLVRVEDTENEDELKKILFIEVPMALFYSVRTIVEQITVNSGFSSYRMCADSFYDLFIQKYKNATAGLENFFAEEHKDDSLINENVCVGNENNVESNEESNENNSFDFPELFNGEMENNEEYDIDNPFNIQEFIEKIKDEYSNEQIEDYESVCGKLPTNSLEEFPFYKYFLRFINPLETTLSPVNDNIDRKFLIQLLVGSSSYQYKYCLGENNLPEFNFKNNVDQEWRKVSELSRAEIKKLIEDLIVIYMSETMRLYRKVKINSDLAESISNDKIPTLNQFLSIYGIDATKPDDKTFDDFFGNNREKVEKLYTKLTEYDLSTYQFRNNDIDAIFNV